MMRCRCCESPERPALDTAILLDRESERAIARRFHVSRDSLRRHKANHLQEQVRESKELRMLASSESLIAELNRLSGYVNGVLERAAGAGDDRLTLLAVKEGRLNVDSLSKLGPLGDIEQRLATLEARGTAHDDFTGDD